MIDDRGKMFKDYIMRSNEVDNDIFAKAVNTADLNPLHFRNRNYSDLTRRQSRANGTGFGFVWLISEIGRHLSFFNVSKPMEIFKLFWRTMRREHAWFEDNDHSFGPHKKYVYVILVRIQMIFPRTFLLKPQINFSMHLLAKSAGSHLN